MDLRKSAYLSRVVFKYKVFFKKKLSVSLQSLLLKVIQQLLSVEVTKLIDINLGSSNSVVLIKGQSMAVQGPWMGMFCHSDLENLLFFSEWARNAKCLEWSPTVQNYLALGAHNPPLKKH